MRYCFGGKPLWITSPDDIKPGSLGGSWQEPSLCRSCGASRIYECQIVSGLLHDQLVKKRQNKTQEYPGLEALGVIVIYTCQSDCASGYLYVEEEVVLQAAV